MSTSPTRSAAWPREIGRGCMGAIFEAFRDGGQFEKRAALAIAAHAVYSAEFLGRFKNERQILAVLARHIAPLLDGGAKPARIPFLAMDYVDGVGRWVEDDIVSAWLGR